MNRNIHLISNLIVILLVVIAWCLYGMVLIASAQNTPAKCDPIGFAGDGMHVIPGSPETTSGEFAPIPIEQIRDALVLAEVKPRNVVFDLGSGDGRVVNMAAKEFGAFGVSIELSGYLVRESVDQAEKNSVEECALFVNANFESVDVSKASVIIVALGGDRLHDATVSHIEKYRRAGTWVVLPEGYHQHSARLEYKNDGIEFSLYRLQE